MTLGQIDEHSELVADWNEYERENTENVELERLRNELKEEKLQSQRYAHMLISERLIHDINKKELEVTLNALHQISDAEWEESMDSQFNDVFTTRTINPVQIANEALALVGQEGEGNQEGSK